MCIGSATKVSILPIVMICWESTQKLMQGSKAWKSIVYFRMFSSKFGVIYRVNSAIPNKQHIGRVVVAWLIAIALASGSYACLYIPYNTIVKKKRQFWQFVPRKCRDLCLYSDMTL